MQPLTLPRSTTESHRCQVTGPGPPSELEAKLKPQHCFCGIQLSILSTLPLWAGAAAGSGLSGPMGMPSSGSCRMNAKLTLFFNLPAVLWPADQIATALARSTRSEWSWKSVYSLKWGWPCDLSTYNSPLLSTSAFHAAPPLPCYMFQSISLQWSFIRVNIALLSLPCRCLLGGFMCTCPTPQSDWMDQRLSSPTGHQPGEHWNSTEGGWEKRADKEMRWGQSQSRSQLGP